MRFILLEFTYIRRFQRKHHKFQFWSSVSAMGNSVSVFYQFRQLRPVSTHVYQSCISSESTWQYLLQSCISCASISSVSAQTCDVSSDITHMQQSCISISDVFCLMTVYTCVVLSQSSIRINNSSSIVPEFSCAVPSPGQHLLCQSTRVASPVQEQHQYQHFLWQNISCAWPISTSTSLV